MSGGQNNTASTYVTSVSGGESNAASGEWSSILGGNGISLAAPCSERIQPGRRTRGRPAVSTSAAAWRSALPHRPLGLALHLALADRLALVEAVLAAGERELDLRPAGR